MKRIFFIWLSLLAGFSVSGQQGSFLYLENELRNGFYARIGDRTYSSSPQGHLLIAPLKDSSFTFILGLPGGRQPELQFEMRMDRDKGFEIRRRDGAIALYDWRNNQWYSPNTTGSSSSDQIDYQSMRTDPYASLMAGLVNDSAVLFNTILPEPVATRNTPPLEKSMEAATDAGSALAELSSDSAATEAGQTIAVTNSGTESPSPETPNDSIKTGEQILVQKKSLTEKPSPLLVPGENASARSEEDAPQDRSKSSEEELEKDSLTLRAGSAAEVPKSADSTASPLQEEARELKQETLAERQKSEQGTVPAPSSPDIRLITQTKGREFVELLYFDRVGMRTDTIDISIALEPEVVREESLGQPPLNAKPDPDRERADSVSAAKDAGAQTSPSRPAEAKGLQMINSDCRRFATDQEIDKLRIAMLKEKTDALRLKQAEKLFRTRCFTVLQVRGLSELFEDNDGRFQFFEAVYPFISDSGNFRYLEDLLNSDFYKARFRNLLPSNQ